MTGLVRLSLSATILFAASLPSGFSQQPVSSPPQAANSQPALTARDMFWSASDLVGNVAPNPAAKTAKKKAAARPKPRPRTETRTAPKQIDPAVVSDSGYGPSPHLVRTSLQRLGLRYTILKLGPGGSFAEVLPTATFHNGDQVKFSLMANAAGYLYLIQQGTSGNWSVIFPDPKSAAGSNHVAAGHVRLLPAFEFTGPPGTERLFMVLSRQPVKDLDQVIFGLRQPTQQSAPEAAPAGGVEEASNTINDALIQRLQSRDLTPVQEQVSSAPAQAGQDGEKAVYVVNAAASSAGDSMLIARFVLNHE